MQANEILSKELFKDKTVFVTGGGSGINLGVAKTFASLGASVAICGRSQDKLDAAIEELNTFGNPTFSYSVDVRNYDELATAIEKAGEALGPIHTLIPAAAGNFICPAEAMSANAFKSVIDIDLLGSFHACKAAVEQLKKTQGNIIFISAGQGQIPYFAQCHVGAAKAGIDNMMKNLALEWGQYGIRANCIVPGPIEGTEGMKRLAPGNSKEKIQKAIPLQRFGQAHEIGNVATFLASPLASYVTGCVLVSDGGQNLPGSGQMIQAIMDEM